VTTTGVDGLRRSRLAAIWWAMLGTVGVLVAVYVASGRNDGEVTGLGVAIMAAVSITDLATMVWFRRLGAEAVVAAESNEELRSIYTRRMVLSSVFAWSPALVGLALSLAFAHPAFLAAGVAVTIPALVYAGPRRGDIEALDGRLMANARPFRLSAALGD